MNVHTELRFSCEEKRQRIAAFRTFGFSNRVVNALILNDVRTVQALVALTRMEVLRLQTLGSGSIKEIEKVLGLHGLQFRGEVPLLSDCKNCGVPFIKDHQSRQFCSTACGTSARNGGVR